MDNAIKHLIGENGRIYLYTKAPMEKVIRQVSFPRKFGVQDIFFYSLLEWVFSCSIIFEICSESYVQAHV